MNHVYFLLRRAFLLLLILICSKEKIFAQTAFTSPVMTTISDAGTSFNAAVVGPETVGAGCAEIGQTWNHIFSGATNRRLNGFTISATSYYVNNYGTLSTVMRRNNTSGTINPPPGSCSPSTAIPWNDRQIVFFEGTRDLTTNVAQIVNSFPSTTLPGTAGYNNINEMNLVFSRGFINSGADNIFNNNSGTGSGFNSNANNIERMDVFVSGGVLVTAANLNRVGFVIACRGPADDPLVISAIKGLSGGNNIGGGTNYVYDDIIKINSGWTSKTINGGSGISIVAAQRVTLLSGITSVVMRRMDSTTALDDQLPVASYPTVSSYVAAQNIVAMFFTFADLGLSAGETFYGYSVAGYDVPATNSDQFNSYLNSTYFPLNTNPTNGGVDLSGFPGMFGSIDIDDDDDGLPDYLEFNSALAFQDNDLDGILNYCDADYAGFIDNNADGINDNFDPSADSDGDLTPNFSDSGFPGFVDSNSDGINDNFDKDKDGIPNHLDLDSDNDGIPDTAESFGVDANGDGKIDNYSDTDADGLSQNVDATNTGAISSGAGLGAIDTDGDSVPNYFDLDSDNDGVPDVVEVYGTDGDNDGKIDGFTDTDLDGFSNNVDGDIGNDGTAENSSAALLCTGSDGNSDGRCDAFPYKNMDTDTKPNPYDMDSDKDGILDVIEAGFSDADFNGVIDGALNSDGWNSGVAALGSLSLPNTDANGRVNIYDIDSDDDGIPDNVEGLSTLGYLLPDNTDTDSDGLDDRYDNTAGFGGNGINPVDTDLDTFPDYIDIDTDSDGQNDIKEGNDYNLNGIADDIVTILGADTDDDGLDNRFDTDNASSEGTSAYMGDGGSFTGDASPGSNTMVQKTLPAATDRDWRWLPFLLDCDFTTFNAVLQGQNEFVMLDWTVYCRQKIDYFEIERSFDGVSFDLILSVAASPVLRETVSYNTTDDISILNEKVIYYRLKAKSETGRLRYSPVVSVKINSGLINTVLIAPNPVKDRIQINIQAEKSLPVEISIADGNGKIMLHFVQSLLPGTNHIVYDDVKQWRPGIYLLFVNTGNAILTRKFIVLK